MKKILIIIFIIVLSNAFCFAKNQNKEDDYLYSEAYFDYLIECAQEDIQKQNETIPDEEEISLEKELNDEEPIDEITENFDTFKLKIETNTKPDRYGEIFQKDDTKTIIPISEKFQVVQDLSKTRNKYNSNDYKVIVGGEYFLNKFIGFDTGFETNFRGYDQIPSSRKIYVSPELNFSDKVSLKFHNKMNMHNYSFDHDIGLNVSPFKSKALDFGVYAGLTRKQTGDYTNSINFSTNFYFF